MIGKVWVVDSCYATGWHRNRGTRSRTVVREKNWKRKRNNVGERKSRTLVMPRDWMRIEEPGRGPWCENEKKKGRMEEKGSPGLLLCHGMAWEERNPVEDRGAKMKKKKKGQMGEKGSPGLLLCHTVARGTWHLVVDRGAKKKKERKRANEGSASRGLLLLFCPVK